MIEELHQLDGLAAEMTARANRAGVMLIWRTQCRTGRGIVVRDGRPEGTSIGSASGHGAQVVTQEGRTALVSRDDLREDAALALLGRSIELAARGEPLGLETATLPALEPLRAREIPDGIDRFDNVDLREAGRLLAEMESEIAGEVPGVQLRMSYRVELDAWRVFRSDGTDVMWAVPRCTIAARATQAGGGAKHGVSTALYCPHPDVFGDPPVRRRFMRRAAGAARLALELPDAPSQPAGSFPLVIDYALAKGLAHEAFGHASEADGFRSSILATDGRFRRGESVGADHVSIIDEPVAGDHAWQPFSANGVRRRRALIVDHGRLHDALSDPWSAEAGGVELTGAARAESFRSAPQPRMTNIRIQVDDPLPAPGEFEDYGPEEVRELLRGAGVFERHPEIVFLSGYSGGQVNTVSGDFVFNCKAIYAMTPTSIELRKPAIFSGSMFGALRSLREAFGPLELDALGYCGKWGQSVPSSGGSHRFLVMDPDPTVRLGGR